jgi:hypothetical protein
MDGRCALRGKIGPLLRRSEQVSVLAATARLARDPSLLPRFCGRGVCLKNGVQKRRVALKGKRGGVENRKASRRRLAQEDEPVVCAQDLDGLTF